MATPNLSLPLTPQPSSKKEHMQTLLMPLTLEGLYDPLKAAELFVRDHTDIRITVTNTMCDSCCHVATACRLVLDGITSHSISL